MLLAGLACCVTAFAHAGSTPDKTVREDSIELRVTKVPDTLEGYRAFFVSAVNFGPEKRSASAKILLNNARQKTPKGASGDCTLFLEFDENRRVEFTKQCRAKAPSDDWDVEILHVYDF